MRVFAPGASSMHTVSSSLMVDREKSTVGVVGTSGGVATWATVGLEEDGDFAATGMALFLRVESCS